MGVPELAPGELGGFEPNPPFGPAVVAVVEVQQSSPDPKDIRSFSHDLKSNIQVSCNGPDWKLPHLHRKLALTPEPMDVR